MWLLIAVAIVTLFAFIYRTQRKSANSPPGPRGLPFVGYYPFLGNNSIAKLQELAKKYGDVMKIHMLGEDYYYFNSMRAIKEALVKQGDNVAGRAVDKFNLLLFLFEKDMVNDEREPWSIQRRFVVKHLSTLGMGKSDFEQKAYTICDYMIESIYKLEGKPTDFKEIFTNYITNTISMLLFSRYFKLDDPLYLRIRDLPIELFATMHDVDAVLAGKLFYLSVRLRPKLYRQMVRVKTEYYKFTSSLVKERMNESDAESKHDLLQSFLREMKGKHSDIFNMDTIVNNISNIYVAGVDTSMNWLYFAMNLMALHTSIQKKVQQEIDEKVGKERRISLNDRKLLNYTEAVIAEIDRFAIVLPFGLIRVNFDPFEFDGYTIPKRSLLVANLFNVSRDEEMFKNPHNFDPNNFLDENGRFSRADTSIHFSYGKRNCLGSRLAEDDLFIAFATLLQKFDWVGPNGNDVKFKVCQRLLRHVEPYEVCALPR